MSAATGRVLPCASMSSPRSAPRSVGRPGRAGQTTTRGARSPRSPPPVAPAEFLPVVVFSCGAHGIRRYTEGMTPTETTTMTTTPTDPITDPIQATCDMEGGAQ